MIGRRLPVPTALLRNFRKDEGKGVFVFQITGKEEDFETALILLKRRIPLRFRSFDDETKFWTVKRNPDIERTLKAIFQNGAAVIDLVDAQLKLSL